ncbi:MAG: MarR family transcriptional regulator [Lachnospiraceae bacterium]|jgi:DNA-binding MarR family transcriptional regulator|nr:MarR family transcriptional regulator [Lachnospiraceae bacterium]MBQ5558530.1 MarR family transcriptional regulator [Lachnospiraceae bacterium]
MNTRDLSEEVYGLLAELLNSKGNRNVLDSIRGEYGVLRYLTYVEDGIHAGELTKHLHVVPGRMTDILKSLEAKRLVIRKRDGEDMRRVRVFVTEKGKTEAKKKRDTIQREYQGMYKLLGEDDIKELIRLLQIILGYSERKKEK